MPEGGSLRFALIAAVTCLLVGCQRSEPARLATDHNRPASIAAEALIEPDFGVSGTFSIAAVDPESGICGVAVASMFPAVGSAGPYVKGGVGAFCTQHYHNPDFGPRALELLEQEKQPNAILAELLAGDMRAGQRQLAIVDRNGNTAQHNPPGAPQSSRWWGAISGRNYACQGNTLCGPQVLTTMASAFESTRATLADRLLAALVAGDCAGGDHRGRLAAAVVLAKPGVEGLWLDVHVDKSDDAVLELAKQYVEMRHESQGAWAESHRPWQHPCADRPEPKPPQE